MKKQLLSAGLLLLCTAAAVGADNLRLNPNLDFTSDSQDGPLIIGDHMEDGAVAGKPNYLIFYAEG